MTIGVLIVAAVIIYMGLPYSDVLGDVYIALSSAMACRVFRMLMLCRWETEDVTLSTRGVEIVLMAGMAEARHSEAVVTPVCICNTNSIILISHGRLVRNGLNHHLITLAVHATSSLLRA